MDRIWTEYTRIRTEMQLVTVDFECLKSQLCSMTRKTILEEILKTKRDELASLTLFRKALEGQVVEAPPLRGFEVALQRPSEVSVIAEFKRRSPSAGDINPYAQVAGQASVYEASGAAAISILTDETYFGGSLGDLRSAREAVGVPLLRKDFILEPVQLYEARSAGADAILLIARVLTDSRLRELLDLSDELGLAALVEAHDEGDIDKALGSGARLIGVNARDLASFEVNFEQALRLIESLPSSVVAVAESGISSPEDAAAAGSAGADAILVGGWLMKGDPQSGVESLVGHPRRPRRGEMEPPRIGNDAV
jgi:indole-3-glycerol phosphate synthase